MKTFVKQALSLAMVAALTACGGGGGGNYSTGGTYFSHAELASEFVRRLNVDVAGYDVSLVKTNTLQYDYIVVYDRQYQTYDAYYLGGYNPGENMANYLNKNEYRFYYDLIPESGNTYRDFVTGKLFEINGESLNLDQIAALQENEAIKDAMSQLMSYGMSEEASLDFAKVTVHAAQKQAAGGVADTKMIDALSKKYGKKTYSQVLAAQKAGDVKTVDTFAANLVANTGIEQSKLQEIFMGK